MWCQGERHGKEMEVMLKKDGWVNPLLLHLNRVNLLLSHLNRASLLLTHLNPNSFQVKGTFFSSQHRLLCCKLYLNAQKSYVMFSCGVRSTGTEAGCKNNFECCQVWSYNLRPHTELSLHLFINEPHNHKIYSDNSLDAAGLFRGPKQLG